MTMDFFELDTREALLRDRCEIIKAQWFAHYFKEAVRYLENHS